MTSQRLASAFLAEIQEGGPVADLLWKRAGDDVPHKPAPPSAATGLVLAKGSVDVAVKVATALSDADALHQLARSDTRKKVRRAVAENTSSSQHTLEYLFQWALGSKVQAGDLVKTIFGRKVLPWEFLRDSLKKVGGSLPKDVTWYPVAAEVQSVNSKEAYLDAFSCHWMGLSEQLLGDVFTGKVEGLTLTEVLSAEDISSKEYLLGSLLSRYARTGVTVEVALLLKELIPTWSLFPQDLFLSHGRPAPRGPMHPGAVEVLAGMEHTSSNLVLAASQGVPSEVRTRLLMDPRHAELVLQQPDLQEEVIEAALALAEPGAVDPLGRRVNPAALIAQRALPGEFGEKVMRTFLDKGLTCDFVRLLVNAPGASSGTRLRLLRTRGSWHVTSQFLAGKASSPRPGEVAALFEEPGRAFAQYVRGNYGASTGEVVPSTREEIAACMAPNVAVVFEHPWCDEVLGQLPALLTSALVNHSRVVSYALKQLGPLRHDAAAMEAFLSLVNEWRGTVPELVEVVTSTLR